MSSLRSTFVDQFGKPVGPLGVLVGLIMRIRPSNRLRNERTVDLLDIRPSDRVLEVGFGPGLAVARASELASAGKIVGIDHSELMLREASRRNARGIAQGRVELLLGSADAFPRFDGPFDKAFAVNVYMFWKDPVLVLGSLRAVMRPGGLVALTLQPRNRGATRADTIRAGDRMMASLRAAGFAEVRTEILEMAPVAAVCALGRA
jgi:ubiquinone/menaquinone biosynthesis C-methylase UbiE